MNESVNVVLGNSLGNSLSTIDMNVGVGEVPETISFPSSNILLLFDTSSFYNSLGGILATDKVVNDV